MVNCPVSVRVILCIVEQALLYVLWVVKTIQQCTWTPIQVKGHHYPWSTTQQILPKRPIRRLRSMVQIKSIADDVEGLRKHLIEVRSYIYSVFPCKDTTFFSHLQIVPYFLLYLPHTTAFEDVS